jgi:hypothetical protein
MVSRLDRGLQTGCLAAALSLGASLLAPLAYAEEPQRVALVIGLSVYEHLPTELALDTARSEAADVARALEQQGGYDKVRLLTDASATLKNLQAALRDQIADEVGANDTLLLYFVGHGVGADYGDPRILLYDTDPDALDSTSMSLVDLNGYFEKYIHCRSYIIAFDAAHSGTINNLAMLGPTGDDWPGRGQSAFVVSAGAPRQIGRPGVFAGAFLQGVSGRADANGDGLVTASEMNNYLVTVVPQVAAGTQNPTVVSSYDPNVVVAVVKAASRAATGPAARVDKAKFVFQGGMHPTVQCQAAAPVACDPACYVWDVPAGPCTVSMSVNGEDLSGEVSMLYRGAYTCGSFQGALRCSSPPPP